MKTHVIILLSQVESDFVTAIQRHVGRFALAWRIVVMTMTELERQPERVGRDLAAVDGVITNANPDRFAALPIGRLVGLGWQAGPRRSGCWLDDRAVGTLAARHFEQQGLSQVATVRNWNLPVRQRRFAAFFAQAGALGLACHRYAPPVTDDPRRGEADLVAWLEALPKPVGIFLHQDSDALDLLRVCAAAGLGIGRDILVLGVDDIPACRTANPTLSSIAVPWARLGEMMAIELQRLLAHPAAAGQVLPVDPLWVVMRESTRAPSSGDAVVDAVRAILARDPADGAIAELARRHGLSASQLRRRFRTTLGASPVTWRNTCRVRAAQRLLVETDLDHAAIARRCGLASPAALWDLFRRNGLAKPSEWRHGRHGR